jgi:glycosyltransferase involved in cell wall biosynthesis
MVTIEAMGCGCAVIASSIDAIGDVVGPDTGILVKPGDAAELAEKIRLLLANRRLLDQMAQNGRARAGKVFDWRVAGDRYFRLIHEYGG